MRIASGISAFIIVSTINVALAQRQPINWTVEIDSVQHGQARVKITALVAPGWHLYSQFMDEGGPMPTRFSFDENGYKTIGFPSESGKKDAHYDEIYDMEIVWYDGDVLFKQPIALSRRDAMFIKGFVEYMVCNNEVCMPGKKEFAVVIHPGKK